MLETNKVLTLAEIDRQLRYMEAKPIAEALNLSVQTLYRIKRGENKSPSHDTVLKLSDYFIKREVELEKEREVERELDISIMTNRGV